MKKVFISGSRLIKELNSCMVKCLDRLIEKNYEIIVGDCYGVDNLVIKYCNSKGYGVNVYYKDNCRVSMDNELNSYIKCGGINYEGKDIIMSVKCDMGLVYMVKDGSKGSVNNYKRLKRFGKKCYVVLY